MTAMLAAMWTALALFGLAINIWLLQDAKVDREYVKRWAHSGTRLIVANANVRRERVRALIQTAFFMAGVVALLTAPNVRPGPVQTTRIGVSLALMLAAALTVVNSLMDRRDRKALLKEIRAQERKRLHG